MPKKDRTVIERLEDIENKMPASEKPRSFSKATGISIEEYLRIAKVYALESDERSLKKEKRDRTAKVIVSIVLVSLFFAFAIVSLFVNKGMEWLLIISASLSLIALIVHLLMISKQKSKQLVQSFWSIERPEFYITSKNNFYKVNKEERHSLSFYIVFVTKILAYVGFSLVFLYFSLGVNKYMGSDSQILNSILYYAGSVAGYLAFFANMFGLMQNPHKYYNYVFETDGFYFFYPSYELTKK